LDWLPESGSAFEIWRVKSAKVERKKRAKRQNIHNKKLILSLDLNPDLDLDPDLYIMNADTKHWF
jgi:hypothetical protein